LLRLEFRAELKKIVRQIGTTTLYVTHDQAEAMSLGDRVAVMRGGRIVQLGAPLDVYDRPSERFVGGFLGAPPMNFFPATVERNGGGPVLVLGDQHLTAPSTLDEWVGRPVLVGVRAENIEVSTEAAPGWVTATVEVVEPTGAAVLLTVRLGEHQIKVQTAPGFRVAPDDAVWLRSTPEALRLYDPETSLALRP
jgi:multiple sugar transport system ATP-binding protein